MKSMEIKDLNRSGIMLEERMQLRTLPFGLKFFENEADVPKEAFYPMEKYGKHMALCQAFYYVRAEGATIAMRTEDHWCWAPLIGFGNVECEPGSPAFEEICKTIHLATEELGRQHLASKPQLPLGKYPVVVMAPLKNCTFEPDVVIIYADTAQTTFLCNIVKTVVGGNFTSEFDGIDACLYCTIPSFTQNEFRITLPDPGDRERAMAKADELILSVPGGRMKEFFEAFEKQTDKRAYGYPSNNLLLDFPRPAFYNKIFTMWGLATDKDWNPDK